MGKEASPDFENKEMEFINTNKELIKRVGFEIEDFGERHPRRLPRGNHKM